MEKKNKLIPLLLLPLTFSLFPYEGFAQKLAPTALLAARQQQVSRHSRIQRVEAHEMVSGFIRISDASAIPELEALGIVVRSNIKDRILTANIPVGALEAAAELETVERIELGGEVKPSMDVARADGRADLVRSVADGLGRAYKGKDVIVGVVDQGFEYTHLDFKGEDGITPRIKQVWNQNYNPNRPESPAGFTYGTEYKTWNAIAAVDNDFQYDKYHGSHVAGIAAGADLTTPYYGVATESDLVLVSYDTTADQIIDGVKYIFDYADRVGKPCVINLSIGMHTGPHDGTSLTDQALEALSGPGRIIVGAVGNEGTTPMHVGKRITPDNPLKVIPAFYDTNNKQFVCDFWGEPGKKYSVQPIAVNSLKGSIVGYGEKISSADYDNVRSVFNMAEHGVEGYVDVTVGHDLDNGRGNFYIQGTLTGQGTGRMVGLLITTEEDECVIDGWHCYYREFTANANCQKQGFTPGDYKSLASEIGGTSRGIISVGSYSTKLTYTNVEGTTYYIGGNAGSGYVQDDLSPFSSNGPTTDGRLKPEVCAPGAGIVSAAQRHAIQTGTCAATSTDSKGNKYYYEYNVGTSMASPYVTGTVALWLEANPELSPDDIRSILRATSRRDAFTGDLGAAGDGSENGAAGSENGAAGSLPAGDNRWGYGKIDTYRGLLAAIDYDPSQSGITAHRADADNLRAAYDPSTRQLTLYQSGSTADLYNAAGRRVAVLTDRTTDLSSLPSGTYIIRMKYGAQEKVQKMVK